jgi:parvulin-like peptidyl-prolyl isomerase
MRFSILLGAALFAAATPLAFAAAEPPPKELPPMDAPLVKDGDVVVDRADFEGSLLRVPEQYRAEVRMSRERISTLIDSVYIARVLAERARKEGMDKDPAIQARMRQVQEAVLADLYRQKLDDAPITVDLEKRARELYEADHSKYVKPEQVRFDQILVTTQGRTPAMAHERAQKAYEDAKSGTDDFLAYALRYSDEQAHGGLSVGEYGWTFLPELSKPVADTLAKLKPGEISAPVESEHGWHVLKLVERLPARPLTFDEAKGRIIEAETARIKKDRWETYVRELRSSPTAQVNTKNIDALVISIDPELIKRAQELPAAAAAASAAKPTGK